MLSSWLEHFLITFIPLFVALDPIGLIPIFLGMAQGTKLERRNVVVNEAVVTALLITVTFLFLGRFIFHALGITDSDFRIAAGLILFQRLLGLRAMRAVSKIVALLLAAIAVNLVRRGLT